MAGFRELGFDDVEDYLNQLGNFNLFKAPFLRQTKG